MEVRIVRTLTIVIAFATVDGLQNVEIALHPRLNEIDRIDEFDDVIGSVKLNSSNFEQQLNSSEYNFVLFYAPWCEYCLKILPEWTEATKIMNGQYADLVRYAQVDCVAEETLCFRLDIKDCPTVRVYKRGPPAQFELVQPYDMKDTIQYMQEYLFNSLEKSDSGGTD